MQKQQMNIPTGYSVDTNGNGHGRIESTNGEIYEGDFQEWKRDGYGVQKWLTGEMYRGTWINDEQLEGMFIDREKRQWKGNFLTGEVYLVKDGTNETEVELNAEEDQNFAGTTQKLPPMSHKHPSHMQNINRMDGVYNGPDEYGMYHRYGTDMKSQTLNPSPSPSHTSSELTRTQRHNQGSQSYRGSNRKQFAFSSRGLKRPNTQRQRRKKYVGGKPPKAKKKKPRKTFKQLEKERKEREAWEDQLLKQTMNVGGLMYQTLDRFKSAIPYSPGPAAYTPDVDVLKKKTTVYSFGKNKTGFFEKLVKLKNKDSPGPIYQPNYNNDSNNKKGASFSFGGKQVLNHDVVPPEYSLVPGPGKYMVEKSVGRDGRTVNIGGPNKVHVFGTADRYKDVYLSKHHAKSFVGKHSPGPGAYFPQEDGRLGKDTPGYTMTGRNKNLINADPKVAGPGPGSHQPYKNEGLVYKGRLGAAGSGGYSWGKAPMRLDPERKINKVPIQSRMQLKENLSVCSPGPAAYCTTVDGVGGTAVSFGPKMRHNVIKDLSDITMPSMPIPEAYRSSYMRYSKHKHRRGDE